MRKFPRTISTFLIFISIVLFFSSFNTHNTIYSNVLNESVIDWQNRFKLKQSDFKATRKWNASNTVANSYCGFGYSITDDNSVITGSIFVKFYCDKSWFNSDIDDTENIRYILKHEQLHFDICELYGRKLYKEILSLIRSNRLNQRNIDKIQSKLKKQYSNYQKTYDNETNHSINVKEQHKWERKVKNELTKLSDYSDYTSF